MKVAELLLEGKKRESTEDRTFRGRDLAELRKDYARWKRLVNMPSKTLKKFLDTPEGEEAGLSKKEAKKLRIKRGRDSARAILRMRSKPFSEWSSEDINWMYRQLSFISRMTGNRGPLMKDGEPTRKLTSLWVWGNMPRGMSPNKYL
jgi:hypothetical protein